MSKHFAVALFCFIPGITFSQSKNGQESYQLYRQIDSLQFSIFHTRDSIQRISMLSQMKNNQVNSKLELYRALVRLENNRLSAYDSLLLNISVVSKDSGGVVQTITAIEIDGGTLQSLIGDTASIVSLFSDFPKLQKQYHEDRLIVDSRLKHMKFASPNMDLPSIPKMPAATAQAKKILADRMLYWMTNACGICHCQNELSSMLEEEKKSKMSIDQVIASRRLFVEYVINTNAKNRL